MNNEPANPPAPRRLSLEERPPIPLDQFLRLMGITRKTSWVWRKNGTIKTVNIYGRIYIPATALVEFNRRAEAGEFHREPNVPRRPKKNP